MNQPPTPSLFEVLIDRGGVLKGARVAKFVWMWASVALDQEHEPMMVEVIDAWNERPRTMWRYLAEFRELLPELGDSATPQAFVPQIRASKLSRQSNAGALGRVPAGSLLAA